MFLALKLPNLCYFFLIARDDFESKLLKGFCTLILSLSTRGASLSNQAKLRINKPRFNLSKAFLGDPRGEEKSTRENHMAGWGASFK